MSRDWYAIGMTCGEFGTRWVETDSKHVESYWDDVSRYEVWYPVWEKTTDTYQRVVKTPQELICKLMEQAQAEDQHWKDEITIIAPDGLDEFPETHLSVRECERLMRFKVVDN